MLPLESVVRGSTLPLTLLPLTGMRLNSNWFVRDCQAVIRLVWVNGRPPF